jgi:hypothetical protein
MALHARRKGTNAALIYFPCCAWSLIKDLPKTSFCFIAISCFITLRCCGIAHPVGEPRLGSLALPCGCGCHPAGGCVTLCSSARGPTSFHSRLARALARTPPTSRCWRARSIRRCGCWSVSRGCGGNRSRPGRPPRVELVACSGRESRRDVTSRRWGTHASLERGGVPHEGASGPRARQSFSRGGVRPSSEAEFRPRGRPALKRGGVSPEGALGPAACWAVGVSRAVVVVRRWCVCFAFLLFRENGLFPGYSGALVVVPDTSLGSKPNIQKLTFGCIGKKTGASTWMARCKRTDASNSDPSSTNARCARSKTPIQTHPSHTK